MEDAVEAEQEEQEAEAQKGVGIIQGNDAKRRLEEKSKSG